MACSRQSKSEQEVPVYDLCRGSAEVWDIHSGKPFVHRALALLELTARVRKGVETPTGEDKRGRNPGLFVMTSRHRYQSGVSESIGDLGPMNRPRQARFRLPIRA